MGGMIDKTTVYEEACDTVVIDRPTFFPNTSIQLIRWGLGPHR